MIPDSQIPPVVTKQGNEFNSANKLARLDAEGKLPVPIDDLYPADDNTDLDVSTSAHGLCPKADGNTGNFLRGDGTWAAPDAGGGGSVPTGTGFRHVTSGVEDGAAKLVENADVHASAGIVESKLALNYATHTNSNDPTSDQKAALAGTSGTPSGSNKYVTHSDSRLDVPTGTGFRHVTSSSEDAVTKLVDNTDVNTAAGIVESKLNLNYPTHDNANDPTTAEKAAMVGTSGSPGSGNKFVTDQDSRLTLDGDLTAIAAVTGTGWARRTATNTWAVRELLRTDMPSYLAYGDTLTNAGILDAGTWYKILGSGAYAHGSSMVRVKVGYTTLNIEVHWYEGMPTIRVMQSRGYNVSTTNIFVELRLIRDQNGAGSWSNTLNRGWLEIKVGTGSAGIAAGAASLQVFPLYGYAACTGYAFTAASTPDGSTTINLGGPTLAFTEAAYAQDWPTFITGSELSGTYLYYLANGKLLIGGTDVGATLASKADNTVAITGQDSIYGGGSLTTSRTLALYNDNATPDNSNYYGTDSTGEKGWWPLSWTSITGKPSTFTPATHNHDDRYFTETELSTNGVGAQVHWDNLTNKPSTFSPSAHASSHASGGGDSIKLDDLGSPDDNTDLNANTSRHGLLPKLGGGTTNFLRADGTWAAPSVSGGSVAIYQDNLSTNTNMPSARSWVKACSLTLPAGTYMINGAVNFEGNIGETFLCDARLRIQSGAYLAGGTQTGAKLDYSLGSSAQVFMAAAITLASSTVIELWGISDMDDVEMVTEAWDSTSPATYIIAVKLA